MGSNHEAFLVLPARVELPPWTSSNQCPTLTSVSAEAQWGTWISTPSGSSTLFHLLELCVPQKASLKRRFK